jgi:hypothetical protein
VINGAYSYDRKNAYLVSTQAFLPIVFFAHNATYFCKMKYEVGDEILVLHTQEEGKVIEILNDKMVLIEVRGVRFPAYTDQLDFPYFYRFSKKKTTQAAAKTTTPKTYIDTIPKETAKPVTQKVEEGVWLSFLPQFSTNEFDEEIVQLFKIHVLNTTPHAFQFVYNLYCSGQLEFTLKNQLLPGQDFYVHDVPFALLSNNPNFDWQFSLLTPQKGKAAEVRKQIKLKGKQVFKLIEELKQNNVPTINYVLFNRYPDAAIEEKFEVSSLISKGFKVYEAKKFREHLPPPRSVVDLHMEKLMDNWKQLDNYEILQTQLTEFEKWYELSVQHMQPSLTIIHGVGSGRLRDEIHELLKLRKNVKYFTNQYHPQYGYGATEIHFQY